MSSLLKIFSPQTNKANLEVKVKSLNDFFIEKLKDGVVIAFSGGVDSTFLLWTALGAQKQMGGEFLALSTTSASMPDYDMEDANEFTKRHRIKHLWMESTEIDNPDYQKNDQMRCYYCKTELFSIAQKVADENGMKWIVYGYNSSDISDTRPGHQAAIEKKIFFPLAEFGFTKEDIRRVLAENEIEIAEKPASPCLSSRIAHGIQVTEGRLADIGVIENIIYSAGIKVFRVRLNQSGNAYFLRIEVAEKEIDKIIDIRDLLISEGKKRGYKWVTLDLAGYRLGGGSE